MINETFSFGVILHILISIFPFYRETIRNLKFDLFNTNTDTIDISKLITLNFIRRLSKKKNFKSCKLPPGKYVSFLSQFDWPGNFPYSYDYTNFILSPFSTINATNKGILATPKIFGINATSLEYTLNDSNKKLLCYHKDDFEFPILYTFKYNKIYYLTFVFDNNNKCAAIFLTVSSKNSCIPL